LFLEGVTQYKKIPSPIKSSSDHTYDPSEGLSAEDITFIKNCQGSGKYTKYNALSHADPSLVDPRTFSQEDAQLYCCQCKEVFPAFAKDLMLHFKETCPDEEGIHCNKKPFCKFIGTRR
jgi:hypothetical protein